MKLILSIGLFVFVAVAFAHHEGHDSPCAQPLYQLPKNAPACLASIPRFYHDHASGKCLEFSYDGCNKNENNFETKEECEKVCNDCHEEHKGHDHSAHVHSADCNHGHEHCGHGHGAHEHGHGHDHSHH